MKILGNESWKQFLARGSAFVLIAIASLAAPCLMASDNPFDGYANTNYYFLDYADGTSFAPGGTSDVRIHVKIAGESHVFNVDTGSRGLYASSTELGPNFDTAGSYAGEIQLDSSGRVSSGLWTPTTLTFDVKDKHGATTTVNSSVNILCVTTLFAQMGRTASFGVDTSVPGYNGTVNLDGGGTAPVVVNAEGKHVVYLTHNESVNEQISYSNNIKGLIHDVSNFGIGFDLSGASGGTGPIGNNMNQIYNPLINLDRMQDGTLLAGYIVKTNGIQLGLTANDTGYAYTTLNPTGFTSTNSEPDWQTPMGQTVVNGITNGPGSIVMDSGIPNAFISAPGLTVDEHLEKLSVYLMNSGGMVGYHIDLDDADNVLNPESVLVVEPGTHGIYSQNQLPFRQSFFNTGRHVFEAFDMLYDAENGYMGVIPNSFGAADPHVFFAAQAGGFPNPIPEGNATTLVLIGFAVVVLHRLGSSTVLFRRA